MASRSTTPAGAAAPSPPRAGRAFARPLVVALALAALIAIAAPEGAPAAKDRVVVRDATRETSLLSRVPSLDIIRTAAVRRGGTMVHKVRMRRRVRPRRGSERPSLFLNTRGGRRSAAELLVFGKRIYELPRRGKPKPIADARLRSKGRNWTIRFARADLPANRRYGWVVMTQRRNGKTADLAPPRRYARAPR